MLSFFLADINSHLDSILYGPDSKCNLAKPEPNAFACVGKGELILHNTRAVEEVHKAYQYFAAYAVRSDVICLLDRVMARRK